METSAPPTSAAGKYLTVLLGGESYGIAVLLVREIIRMQKVTPVPQLPGHIKGVINLRGRVIPVHDLRLRLGVEARFTDRACILVVEFKTSDFPLRQIGLIVDAVDEVLNFSDRDIEPTPEFGAHVNTEYLLGVARSANGVRMLLDVRRVLSAREDTGPAGLP